MPTYRCPRCSRLVEGTGVDLVCPGCGFGADAPPRFDAPAFAAPVDHAQPAFHGIAHQPKSAKGLALTAGLCVLAVAAIDLLLDVALAAHLRLGGFRLVLSLLSLVLFIPAAVFAGMAIHRLVSNAHAAQPHAGLNPGWASGAMFIPLANAVLPFFPIRRAVAADGGPRLALVAWFIPWSLSLLTTGGILVAAYAAILPQALGCADESATGTSSIVDCVLDQDLSILRDVQPYRLAGRMIGLVAALGFAAFTWAWTKRQDAQRKGAAPPG